MVKVGDTFETNNCGKCVVTSYNGSRNVTVRFVETGYITKTQSYRLISGKVKDLLCRSVYGVGFIGVGKYSKIPSKQVYDTWNRMLNRCYGKSFQKGCPSYIGCTVCDEWHNFQNFAEWYESNHPKSGKFHLDKDLKVIGSKVYSPETCLFVPQSVNKFIIDRKAGRGRFMIGACLNKNSGKFTSSCKNPFSRKLDHLGTFNSELEAHLAWRSRKSELCGQLAIQQDSPEVMDALLNWKFALDNNLIHKYH